MSSWITTDQGTQFTDKGFRKWCQYRGIRQRFGAVQKYGSISVIERLMRTMKSEALRALGWALPCEGDAAKSSRSP